jgi:hypothetical protein
MKKAEFILVSCLKPELAKMLLFTPAKDIDEALAMATPSLGRNRESSLCPRGA